jgi:hypothetical protein
MRLSFTAIVSALALVVGANVATASVITEYTNGSVDGSGNTISTTASNLGLTINLAGIATATIPNTPILPGGYEVVDQTLDGTNTGTLNIQSGNLTLQNFSYNVTLGFLGSVVATGTGVEFNVNGAGPIAVTNGNFSINSSTPGELTINNGTISLVGTVLGQSINTSLDFSTNPVTQLFSGLGSSTIPGTATQSLSGATLGINYNGYSIDTTIISGTLTLPTTITITGSAHLAAVVVPEVGSIALVGCAIAGLGYVARRRRSV